jgi:RND family efflux transporter MFP subunit
MSYFAQSALTIVCVGIAVGSLSGCGGKTDLPKAQSSKLPVIPVQVRNVQIKTQAMTEDVMGTVRAKTRATLEAKVSGRIDKLPVLLGQRVKRGDLIAHLDAVEIAARLDQATASLEQAERDEERAASLFQQQTVTRAEYDAAEARYRMAKGETSAAKAMMDYVEIHAPFDGVVTKKWVEAGDFAAPGKPLIAIEDPAALQLDANVPEAVSSHLQLDARLAVRVDGVAEDLIGIISEIAPQADSLSRTLQVKLDLPQIPGLVSGRFARLILPIGEEPSLRVPASAIVERGQLEMVFVVANQRAQMRLVKTGKRFGNEIEVLAGLDAADPVVVDGASQLADGQSVSTR